MSAQRTARSDQRDNPAILTWGEGLSSAVVQECVLGHGVVGSDNVD